MAAGSLLNPVQTSLGCVVQEHQISQWRVAKLESLGKQRLALPKGLRPRCMLEIVAGEQSLHLSRCQGETAQICRKSASLFWQQVSVHLLFCRHLAFEEAAQASGGVAVAV